MSDINCWVGSGRLTRDPELRFMASGQPVVSFTIACDAVFKNSKTGEYENRQNFIDVSMFGSRAESLSKIMRKGMKVSIMGELRYSSWEKDGQKRSKLEVITRNVVLPDKPKVDGGYQAAPMQPAVQYAQPSRELQQMVDSHDWNAGGYQDVYDEEIPF